MAEANNSANPHTTAAHAAFEVLLSDTTLSESYKLSDVEAQRQGLSRASDTLDLTYGNTAFAAIVEGLTAAAPRNGGVLYDLGSGSGHAVLAAALSFGLSRCVGVEILRGLHEQATVPARHFEALRSLAQGAQATSDTEQMRDRLTGRLDPAQVASLDPRRMAQRIELHCGDLFSLEVGDADVVFCNCATWEPCIMFRLADKLAAELQGGARVLTVGKPLVAVAQLADGRRVRFDEVWHGYSRFQWGREPVVLHKVVRVAP
jgi:hypothetical protein